MYLCRCVVLRRQARLLPQSCRNVEFYDGDDAVFNGSKINDLKRALDNIYNTLTTEYADHSECVESVLKYLCYYYYVMCDVTSDEIMPVCDETCHLLFDNDDCSELLMVASEELELYNIPAPHQSCSQTHRSFVMSPTESHDCVEIEGIPILNVCTLCNNSCNCDHACVVLMTKHPAGMVTRLPV